MEKLILFPMRRTDNGFVMQAYDTGVIRGTKLVYVDNLRAEVLGIAEQVKSTWVEARDKDGADYGKFCAQNRVALQGCKLMVQLDAETGEPWTTEEGEPFHGVVTV